MRKVMKIRITISTLLLAVTSIAHGQAVPTASTSMNPSSSGLNFSPLDGVFHYALTASEIAQRGYYGPSDWTYSTALSGNASYTAKSEARPFNMRSEEHTSELQSRLHLVCRLLLDKKK